MANGDFVTLANGLQAVEFDGHFRVLAKLPPNHTKRMVFNPVSLGEIPQSDWKITTHRQSFGDSFILDQKSHGSCVGFGSVGALMKARAMRGYSFFKLSGSYVYSQVNGGSDNGAIISDSLNVLKNGTCLDSEAGWDAIYPNRIPVGARTTANRFKLKLGERVSTWNDFMSMLVLGEICVGAVMVGNSFGNLDSDGVVGFDRGPGNHCVHFYDSNQRPQGSKEWLAVGDNSWGLSFGKKGMFKITQRHFESVEQDCYRLIVADEDPQNTIPTV